MEKPCFEEEITIVKELMNFFNTFWSLYLISLELCVFLLFQVFALKKDVLPTETFISITSQILKAAKSLSSSKLWDEMFFWFNILFTRMAFLNVFSDYCRVTLNHFRSTPFYLNFNKMANSYYIYCLFLKCGSNFANFELI